MQGVCKCAENGWGIIARDDGPDMFVHIRAVQAAGYGALANRRTGREMAVDLVLLDPIISPKAVEQYASRHGRRHDDDDDLDQLRASTFMRR
jgi:cold shock CspA family protein